MSFQNRATTSSANDTACSPSKSLAKGLSSRSIPVLGKNVGWKVLVSIPVMMTFVILVYPPVVANDDTQNIVKEATMSFTQMMTNPNTRIPAAQLRQSQAIAIIPKVIQAGFFFGGRRGTGVMMKHNVDGSWSNPTFVSITGGSFGLQAGAKSSDIVLVFPSQTSYDKVMNEGFLKLGGNVTGTGVQSEGHVTRTLDDKTGSDKIYAYTRSEGLFGSTAFEGAKLSFNKSKNNQFYGYRISPSQILSNPESKTPDVVNSLKQVLDNAEANN